MADVVTQERRVIQEIRGGTSVDSCGTYIYDLKRQALALAALNEKKLNSTYKYLVWTVENNCSCMRDIRCSRT